MDMYCIVIDNQEEVDKLQKLGYGYSANLFLTPTNQLNEIPLKQVIPSS